MTMSHRDRPLVHGAVVDEQTRCIHYRSELDIVAIQFACCRRFYPCHQCHTDATDHPAGRWPRSEWGTPAILCGACSEQITIAGYLTANACPSCGAAFNPGCSLHHHLYFETDSLPDASA